MLSGSKRESQCAKGGDTGRLEIGEKFTLRSLVTAVVDSSIRRPPCTGPGRRTDTLCCGSSSGGDCSTPSFQSKSPPFVVSAILLRRISAIRHYLSEDVTKKMLRAFVLSRLDYCNQLLAGCPKYLLSKLRKVRNNAARLIFRTTRSAHVTPMLHSLHWLPIEQRIEYKLSLIISHQAPIYLSELLHLYTPSRQLRSSADNRVFRIPSFQTKSCGQRSFSYQAPVIWNQLPVSVRHSTSVSSFKSSLKTFLFKNKTNFSSVSLP